MSFFLTHKTPLRTKLCVGQPWREMTLSVPSGLCSVTHSMSHLLPPAEPGPCSPDHLPLPHLSQDPISCALSTPAVGFAQFHFRRWLWLPTKPAKLATTARSPQYSLSEAKLWRQSVREMLENGRKRFVRNYQLGETHLILESTNTSD